MHKGILFASFATAMLAACGGPEGAADESGGESISVEEVAARAKANAVKPQPGKYKVTMDVLEVDIPGAPEGSVDMMRSMMGGQTHTYCLRPEDVDDGFEAMAKQGQEGDCDFQRFDVDGGKFDAQMTCRSDEGRAMTMTMNGNGTPTSSEVEMTMKGNMTGMGDSTIHMKARHERIGDC